MQLRRPFLLRAVLAIVAIAVMATAADACPKKGLALPQPDPQPARELRMLNACWYYNWGSRPSPGESGAQFVPMVFGIGENYDDNVAAVRARGHVPVVLVFNEPDLRTMAERRDPDQLLQRWKTVSSLADRISAPAAANDLDPWMKDFMAKARARGTKMDFVALHWYGGPDPDRFLDYVRRVHDAYHMPIWITEFAVRKHFWRHPTGAPYTPEEVLAFLKVVLPALERTPYVERYAWAVTDKRRYWLAVSALFNDDGSLTPAGQYYASFENGRPPRP